MLPNGSRYLTYACAVLHGLSGLLLFVFPETLAPVFAWKVTPFMVMTIGAWSLGNAWLAFINARRWDWTLNRTSLLYLWLFGVGELLVLFAFREKLILQHPIAWLYLLTLVVNAITAFVGVTEMIRLHPKSTPNGEILNAAQKIPAVLFVIFVGFLGGYGIVAQIGDVGTNGGIFLYRHPLLTSETFPDNIGILGINLNKHLTHLGGQDLKCLARHLHHQFRPGFQLAGDHCFCHRVGAVCPGGPAIPR